MRGTEGARHHEALAEQGGRAPGKPALDEGDVAEVRTIALHLTLRDEVFRADW